MGPDVAVNVGAVGAKPKKLYSQLLLLAFVITLVGTDVNSVLLIILLSGIVRYTSCAFTIAEPRHTAKIPVKKNLIVFTLLNLKLLHLYGGVFLLIFKD